MTRYMDAKGVEETDRRLEVAAQVFAGQNHLRVVMPSGEARKPKRQIPTEQEMYASSKGVTEWLGKG